jgi:3D (Asp-Asp-Asp) domain-containing protein
MKKRILALLMILIIIISVPMESMEAKTNKKNKSKSDYKIIGYEYKTVKIKVKVKKKKYLGKFWITHYCPCAQCCGAGGGKVTASGTVPKAGRTVGVNPALIKYGTNLEIGGEDGYVAEDTGGGIGWQHLDVFCNFHQEALNSGVGYRKVYSYTYKYKKKKVKVKVPIYEKKTK